MKSLLGLLLTTLLGFNLFAQNEMVMRMYNPDNKGVAYKNRSALWYMARFDLEAPGYLKKVRVQLEGAGKGNLRLFGHEGGSPYAELEKDLISPIDFEKSSTETEWIEIELSDSVWLANNQFFVAIELLDEGLSLIRDSRPRQSTCQSSSGGEYYPTVLAVPGQHNFYEHLWSLVNYPLWVEAVFDVPQTQPGNFLKDITTDKGLPTTLSNKSVAWGDYNEDGYLDLLIAGRLFKNTGADKSFVDVTDDLGINGSARANTFFDMNNDGYLDILVFHTENHLYINDGNGGFSHKVLDIPEFTSISSFSSADVNNDGYLDLFIGQLWTSYPVPGTNYLFLNDKSNGFSDATSRIYPDYNGETNYPSAIKCDPNNQNTWRSNQNRARRSRGSQFVDFDNDGDLDLYVVNYFLETDEFYENDGEGNFTNIITQKGIDQNNTGSNHGTGVDFFDYDNDGDMDLLLSQFAHPWGKKLFDHSGTTIYENSGAPNYEFKSLEGENGIDYEETHAGAAWGDVNNDGLQDFAITTYYGCRYVELFTQSDHGQFKNSTFNYGIENRVSGEDAVWVDYDADGRLDLCLGEANRFRLLKNDAPIFHRKYLQLKLEATTGNKLAIGSRVSVYVNGNVYTQEVCLGRGQRMQKPLQLHFGLNFATEVEKVEVTWPDGSLETFEGLEVNSSYRLKQGGEKSLSLKESGFEALEIYPNPTKGILKLSEKAESVKIFNAQGKCLKAETNVHELNVSDFPNGVYLLRIMLTKDSDYTYKRILKQ